MVVGKEFVIANSTFQEITLWILFGIVVSKMHSDFNDTLKRYPFLGYVLLLVCCFFLFLAPRYQEETPSELEPDKYPNLRGLWLRSFVIFVVLMLWIKSNLLFSLAVVALLVADQLITLYKVQHLRKESDPERRKVIKNDIMRNSIIFGATVCALVLIGSGLRAYDTLRSKN